VEAFCDSCQVEMRITDHTPGFNWPTHAALPDCESESGRGVFLIQSLMDSAHYVRGTGQNVLVLRAKRRQS
jgi:anti-sigma regulatory factor (Ser/Thr protein kinase)